MTDETIQLELVRIIHAIGFDELVSRIADLAEYNSVDPREQCQLQCGQLAEYLRDADPVVT